jgi:hypothetical protein
MTLGPWLGLVLAILATWRVTHMVVYEDGPGDVVLRLRVRLGDGWAGRMFACFYCLSLWIALPMSLLVTHDLPEWIVAWLATSGGASLIERFAPEPVVIEALPEMEEENHERVLRPGSAGADRAFQTEIGLDADPADERDRRIASRE